jgi:hypothetical protein
LQAHRIVCKLTAGFAGQLNWQAGVVVSFLNKLIPVTSQHIVAAYELMGSIALQAVPTSLQSLQFACK